MDAYTLSQLNLPYIEIPECSVCRDCCSGIADVICGYNMIEEIQSGSIPEEDIRKLKIFRVRDEDLDLAAKNWGVYPVVNLLRYITFAEDGVFTLLALPGTKGKCIFLNDQGCRYPKAKPFECGIYPFYAYKLQLRHDYRCQFADRLEDDSAVRKWIGEYATEYLLYSRDHQAQYLSQVKELLTKYNLHVIEWDPQCISAPAGVPVHPKISG